MTGPEHYRAAERLLDAAQSEIHEATSADAKLTALHHEQARLAQQRAQVHATLALAAATAYPAIKDYYGDEAADPREWAGATS